MPSAAAFRYARALVDVVTTPGAADPKKITAELKQFETLMSDNAELRILCATPAIASSSKHAVIDQIASAAGLSQTTRNFIKVVLDRDRISILPEVIEGFETLLNERLGIAVAEITSARALDDTEKTNLQSALKARTGRQVQVTYSQDSSLIAGVVARIGSTVYDGSVRGQLDRLRAELAGRA
ncbi:MAG: ATP synthase F1 subunit delta [Acidobacteria bacterium]|nr:ATP synthase F1 subunit delta [Acidobacteriota bacterium]